MAEETGEDGSDDRQTSESPAEAIIEGASTGGMVGPVGLVGGIVAGWLISRVARRRNR